MKNKLTNNYLVFKSFKSYFLLSVMGVIAGTVGMFIDGIIIGNFFGNDGLVSFGLASPIIIVIIAFSTVFANGGIVSASNYLGAEDNEKFNMNFTVTLLVSIGISLIIGLLSPFYSSYLAVLLGAKGSLIASTSDFIFGVLLGTIFLVLSQVLLSYVRLDGSPSLGMISAVVATIANFIVAILVVTVFDLGLFGIGIANSFSYGLATLVLCIHFLYKKNTLAFTKIKGGFKELLKIIKLGLPTALNRLYVTFRTLITNYLAMWVGGAIVMGALSIQTNIYQIMISLSTGIAMTTLLLGGIFFGEEDRRSLIDLLNISLKVGVGIMVIVVALVWIFAPNIVAIFGDNVEVRETAIYSLRIFSLSLPFSLICGVLMNFYNSVNNLYMSNYLAISHNLIFISMFALILTPLIGQNGIWLCFLLGESVSLIGLFALAKVKYNIVPKSISDFLFLDESFDENIISSLEISLENNIDEIIRLSNKVKSFGEKYPGNDEKINELALCVEEMGGNIIKYGFEKSKLHYIDIRIILTKDNLIFRIRDDGKPFNPIKYADENRESNTGILAIRKIAKTMDYRNTIGLNNLTITL
ncbi:MAG: ATP-binding protein [Methanobrevibacter sp.]|jgi:Na+-driven multidrug efflux pump/anti-sigma regulatory factor (Ser/Thr protein kinase)|nr:ATP-binding protein [Methanobrevibacter sp.]